jgi:predicted TIM-barrel fold metal-dependent hydrolase
MSLPQTAGEDLPAWDCHAHVFDTGTAAAGHYQPPNRSLADWQQAAHVVGAERVVLVQPSVYGTDNRVMLDALRTASGRHRGVAVIDARATDAELDEMHACGVRGVRFNRVSPVGNRHDAFDALAPRLRERGWHVQWYTTPLQLATIADLHARHRVMCVLDHLAGFTASLAADEALWAGLQRIADDGAWIKLSGWYRLDAVTPYENVDATIARAVRCFDTRCVWGSDWPHTRFLEPGCKEPAPAYRDTWLPVQRSLGVATAWRILRDQPLALYH